MNILQENLNDFLIFFFIKSYNANTENNLLFQKIVA